MAWYINSDSWKLVAGEVKVISSYYLHKISYNECKYFSILKLEI